MDIKRVEEALRGVIHPVKGQDIISLNMVEDIKAEGGVVKFKLVFPSPDPLSSSIKKSCEKAIKDAFPGEEPGVRIMELVRERKIAKRINLELGRTDCKCRSHYCSLSQGGRAINYRISRCSGKEASGLVWPMQMFMVHLKMTGTEG